MTTKTMGPGADAPHKIAEADACGAWFNHGSGGVEIRCDRADGHPGEHRYGTENVVKFMWLNTGGVLTIPAHPADTRSEGATALGRAVITPAQVTETLRALTRLYRPCTAKHGQWAHDKRLPSVECRLNHNHDGPHQYGMLEWADAETER